MSRSDISGSVPVCGDSTFGSLGNFVGGPNYFAVSCTASESPIVSSNSGYSVPTGGYFNAFWQTTAPAGLSIVRANALYSASNLTAGWSAGSFWQDGSGTTGDPWYNGGPIGDNSPGFDSSNWAFQVACASGGCNGSEDASALLTSLSLTVSEAQGPTIAAPGASNLWNQAGWIWNTPSDPWTLNATGGDPSGVCSIALGVSGSEQTFTNAADPYDYQQCANPWSVTKQIDTGQFVATAGQLPLSLVETNAAGNQSPATQTVNVDNIPPTVTVTANNDADPGGWAVNHAVSLEITPIAGPSGVQSTSCTDNGVALTLAQDPKQPASYTTSIDGNGAHTVSCTAVNNAVNPQGLHNSGTVSKAVDIDEQPPSLTFFGQDPANPTQVDVQVSDTESAVAGGSLQLARAGTTNWIAIPTSFSNGELTGQIPDSGLKGQYVIQASASSQAGNTGTASETLTLPLRAHAHSEASFGRLVDALVRKKVKKRVLVGWHYGAKLNSKGQPIKVKIGGHYVTKTVIEYVERCTTVETKVHGKTKVKRTCLRPHLIPVAVAHVRFGGTTTVRGLVITAKGVPIGGQPVDILSAPNNGSDSFQQIGTVTTALNGEWSFKLPRGPSRLIRAMYPGSSTILPATRTVKVSVPADITIHVTPRVLPWSRWITISGSLEGGYVPRDGVAMRLLVRYPGSTQGSPLLAFRTDKDGRFRIRWTYHAGRGVLRLPFWIASDSNESDYPFAASASRQIPVTFGRSTPAR